MLFRCFLVVNVDALFLWKVDGMLFVDTLWMGCIVFGCFVVLDALWMMEKMLMLYWVLFGRKYFVFGAHISSSLWINAFGGMSFRGTKCRTFLVPPITKLTKQKSVLSIDIIDSGERKFSQGNKIYIGGLALNSTEAWVKELCNVSDCYLPT